MSYYENRIKALEEKVSEMAKRERMKAIPVEAQLIDSIASLKAENSRLKAEVERLRASSFVTAVPVEQYERIRKMGDAMLFFIEKKTHPSVYVQIAKEWKEAKGEKP